jgi:hypothetical protein
VSSKCRELRRVYRSRRLDRWLPGLASMGGLYGVTLPLPILRPDLDRDWCEFLASARLVEEV